MIASSRRALVDALATHDRLVEIGIGDRPSVARALARRGCHVVAVDISPGEDALAAAREARDTAVPGSLRVRRGDVLALADDGPDPVIDDTADGPLADGDGVAVDAVYACHLPAELQRPTVAFARRLGAACAFTTLGFEEPVVPVTRRALGDAVLYVARDDGPGGVASDRE